MFSKTKNFSFDAKSKENAPSGTVSSCLILLINKSEILLSEVSNVVEKEVLISKPRSIRWDRETLLDNLQAACSEYESNQVYVVLGQDLARIETFQVDGPEETAIETAEKRAQQKFGQLYPDLGIDYSILKTDNLTTLVQLFITKRSLLALLANTFEKIDLDVNGVIPLGEALASDSNTEETSVILWGEDYLSCTLVSSTGVLHSEIVSGVDIYKQIKALLSWFEQHYSVKIEQILMATKKLDTSKIKKKNLEVELNPFTGAVSQNDEFAVGKVIAEEIETTDDDVETELEDESTEKSAIIDSTEVAAPKPPLKLVDQEKTMDSVAPATSKPNTKLIAIIVTVIVVLVGMVVGGFFVYQNAMQEASESPEITITNDSPSQDIPAPTPDIESSSSAETTGETTLDPSNLKASILNGSGTPGAAGDLAEVLESSEITDVDTGNADSYDYEQTVVSVKKGNDELYELVLTALQDDYSVTQGDDLDEDSEYDVVIIVGQS